VVLYLLVLCFLCLFICYERKNLEDCWESSLYRCYVCRAVVRHKMIL